MGFVIYGRTTDLIKPGPSMTFVFVDERADSINDGELYTNMQGYDPYQPSNWVIQDVPSNYHGGSGGVSFADGHAEIHKWKDAVLNAKWPFNSGEVQTLIESRYRTEVTENITCSTLMVATMKVTE